MTPSLLANGGKTGHPPGLLQDDCRKLSNWFASRMNARQEVREVCRLIAQEKNMTDKTNSVTDELQPEAWLFQHEETGQTECVDVQQVEWGFERNNPRWQKIGPLYGADTIDTLRTQLAEAQRELIAKEAERASMELERNNAQRQHTMQCAINKADSQRILELATQLAEAQREAVTLAQYLYNTFYSHEPHYASGKVKWEPCDTPAGVITQIDNMVAGVREQLAEAHRDAERKVLPTSEAATNEEFAVSKFTSAQDRDNMLLSTIERLRNERDALREDAERYRWMRDKETSEGWDIIGRSGTPAAIDAAIDAAKGESNG